MNKRKLIRKMTVPALIVAAISLAGLLILIPINNSRYATHREEFKKYITSFMDKNTAYLKGLADKIKSLPVNPVLINELQAEYLVDHQRSDQPKKYLWMSSTDGSFLFGVPVEDFQKMNNGYDKYESSIKADDYYRDRNDFLMKLIDKRQRVEFSQFDAGDRSGRDSEWRFYKEGNDWGLIQPTSTIFSTPVYDEKGNVIGDLYMKVDDKVNEKLYANESRFENSQFIETMQPIFGSFLGLALVFLWFLLPTWVYIDAEERDVKTPGIWAFLALTSLFFGLTIYLITRPSTLKASTCPKCEGELNGTRAYCPHCGNDLSDSFCQQCQYPIKPEWQFCPNCRAEIKPKEQKLNTEIQS